MASIAIAEHRPSLATSIAVIAKRSWLKFLRTPPLFWTMTVQGVMFLLLFRYIFGGAIGAGRLGYVDFLIPGILVTALIWQGMGTAVGITEDQTGGLFDRLRSLPIPRSAVLAGRAVADTAMQGWGLVIMTIVSFLIGFRLHDGLWNATVAAALIIVYLFAFEWVFITMGLYAGNAQTAQGISIILVPFAFVSSAYVPVSSMPSGLRAIAEHQPVTYMVDTVRTLAGGARAEALLGHSASYFIVRSLIWSAVIVLVFAPIAIARYRRG
jgi:ABC-2 type transport system permease protein